MIQLIDIKKCSKEIFRINKSCYKGYMNFSMGIVLLTLLFCHPYILKAHNGDLKLLDRKPVSRISELGRQSYTARKFIIKYQNKVLLNKTLVIINLLGIINLIFGIDSLLIKGVEGNGIIISLA